MINRNILFVLFFLSALFSDNIKVSDNYYDFLLKNKQFISSKFIEDDNHYYYLHIHDINDMKKTRRSSRNKKNSTKNAYTKARLSAVSNFMESICCGFDVVNFTNINKLNLIDQDNKRISYEFDVKQTNEVNNIDIILKDMIDDKIFYVLKIGKDKVLESNCSCNLKVN